MLFRSPAITTESKDLIAAFDPITGDISRFEQKTDFRYQEADKQARADRATLYQSTGLITLDGGARASDATGATSADHIVMNRTTGDRTAEGNVASTHEPDKKGTSTAMMSHEEVMQGRGAKMFVTANGNKIRYEGSAKVWQGTNRVEADVIDIDRSLRILDAHGKVVSQFTDSQKADAKNVPAITTVRAQDLHYTEESKLATYLGGVTLFRPDMNVTSKELRAYLKDGNAGSALEKALADGSVKIVSSKQDKGPAVRTRTGTSEHAEYYVDEGRVLLEGGQPLFVDSVKGRTTGRQLIWFANDERVLVNGEESKPAETNVVTRNRKK